MTLRDGVEFADGTPLDAKVVKANLERSMAAPTGVSGVVPAPTRSRCLFAAEEHAEHQ